MASTNNKSKSIFNNFIRENNLKQIGRSNTFIVDGIMVCWSYCDIKKHNGRGYIRQLHECADKLIVCMHDDGVIQEYRLYDVGDLIIGTVTRIGPDGTKYYNAIAP